jgi:ketosteroid isomerase-like protein
VSRRTAAGIAWSLALGLAASSPAEEPVTDVLRRQTQELFDALGNGQKAVWEKYLDPEVRYVDESGAVAGKKEMVDGVSALPAGVSGTIRVKDYDARVHGDVAVATWVADETETYHGRELHCRYRTTDTWKKTPDGWRLIAAQVLAMREDPPAVALPAALRSEYVGRYALPDGLGYEIRAAEGGAALEGVQDGRKPEALRAEAPDVLFVPGKPRYRYVARRDASGKVNALIQRREAWDLVWERKP